MQNMIQEEEESLIPRSPNSRHQSNNAFPSSENFTSDAHLAQYLQEQETLYSDNHLEHQGFPSVIVPPEDINGRNSPRTLVHPCGCIERWRKNPKQLWKAYLCWLFGGFLGIHHQYLQFHFMGFFVFLATIFLFTYLPVPFYFRLILPAMWWIGDGIRLKWMVEKSNKALTVPNSPSKDWIEAYQIWFPFGLIGIHRFYLQDLWWGFAYFFSLGFFGIGWIWDGIRMKKLVQMANSGTLSSNLHPDEPRELLISYLFSFPLCGFVGLHQYYLGRSLFGIVYSLTFGLLGFGPFVDWIRMKWLVQEANRVIESPFYQTKKNLLDAYQLCIPVGWLGWHHVYFENYFVALSYLFSLGGFGIMWIVDLFRMKNLLKESLDPTFQDKLSLRDAYICWLPFGGLFGLHHFYMCIGKNHFNLRRLLMGLLYFCTFGLLGIGWFIDLFFMKRRVKEINDEIERKTQEEENQFIQSQISRIEEQEETAQQREADRSLRFEQDLLFAQVVSNDEQEDRAQEEEELILNRSKKEQEEKEKLELDKQKQVRDMAESKLKEYPPEPEMGDDVINLVFRLPNGIRVSRRFYKSQTLKEVKDWIALHRILQLPNPNPTFNIVSDFPKQTYLELDKTVGKLFPVNQVLSVKED